MFAFFKMATQDTDRHLLSPKIRGKNITFYVSDFLCFVTFFRVSGAPSLFLAALSRSVSVCNRATSTVLFVPLCYGATSITTCMEVVKLLCMCASPMPPTNNVVGGFMSRCFYCTLNVCALMPETIPAKWLNDVALRRNKIANI